MKKSLILILCLTWFVNAYSQKEFKYCELVGYSKFLSSKILVAVDSGQGFSFDVFKDSVMEEAPAAPTIETKNEKFYVTTKDNIYEGKNVQTDAKGTYIWKKVEIIAKNNVSEVPKEKKIKTKTYSSMMEAMNYMSKNGWEFIQAYVVTKDNQNVYRWILKKAK